MLEQFVTPNLLPAAAELFIFAASSILLLLDLFLKDPQRSVIYALAQAVLLMCFLITLGRLGLDTTQTFSGLYIDDPLSRLLKLCLYPAVMITLAYGRHYTLARPDLARGEYSVLTLFATLGMMVMISAKHFLSIYLGLELLALSLYGMVAMDRDNKLATEAAMKYFVLGALASGLLLYGMSMLYGASGTLDLDVMGEKLSSNQTLNRELLVFGLVFLVAGLAFKLGAAPFHMWVPDVYHGAPTAVTLLLGAAPKLAAFAIVMRLLVGALQPLATDWQGMLMLLSVLSMAIGNLAAIAQTNIKRMLAYSAISHMGFMLLGVLSGFVEGNPGFSGNAYSSAMFYVVTYVLMTLGTFGVILLLSRAGFEADQLNDYKGLNQRNPWYAFAMLVLMFSMAGVPFFVGFFAKFAVLQAVVAAGYLPLAVVAVIFSLIGAYYYLRVVKLMYFDTPENAPAPLSAGYGTQCLLSANAVAVALLGLFPQTLLQPCTEAILGSF